MGFLADFLPFYPKAPRRAAALPADLDIERALDVELHPHPSLETRRADSGELVLRVRRQLHPAERFLARFVRINPYRQIVLDEHGEYLLTEGQRPGVRLTEVAAGMAARFALDLEPARLGVVYLVRELMLREFVFLVRRGPDHPGPAATGPDARRGA